MVPQFEQFQMLDPKFLSELRLMDDDPANSIVDRILAVFARQAPEMIRTMRESARNQNHETLKGTAHSLKSSAGNLGAVRMAAICEYLEGKTDFRDVDEVLSELESVFGSVSLLLKSESGKKS
jgi:HPt (histidine-containing phosphotransfer) domain-containing protein